MFSLKSPEQEKVYAVFDIGSASVAGALIGFDAASKPHVHFATRESLSLRHEVDHKDLLARKHNVLKKVAAEIVKNGSSLAKRRNSLRTKRRLHIENVQCFLASPWYFAEARTARIENKKDFKVTAELAANFLSNEEKAFIGPKEGNQKKVKNVRVIERSILRADLNGYPATSFLDRSTRTFSANIYLGCVSEAVIQNIKRSLSESFAGHQINFHTFLLPYFTVVRDYVSPGDSYVLIDVTGEVTDIAVVRDGAIEAIASFPIGRNYVIREVSKILKTDQAIALSFIKVVQSGRGEQDFAGRVRTVVDSFSKTWLIKFRETRDTLQNETLFPKEVYLTADIDLAHVFENAIASESLDGLGAAGEKFMVRHLGDGTFRDLCDFSLCAKPDAFLGIESLYLQRLLKGSK